MESRINITGNAYFYSVIKSIPRRMLERVIVETTSHKKGQFVYKNIRAAHNVNGREYITSFVVFKYVSAPSFLTKGLEKELKYGYLLLVEYDDYFIVSKKATSDFFDSIEDFVVELPYEKIAKFRVNSSTKFTKMSVLSVETNSNVLRRQQVEATDLKEVYSTITSSSKAVNSLRIKNKAHETSISISTSRINQLGKKNGLEDFCELACKICDAIEGYSPSACFIDNFAEPLPFAQTIISLTPVSILFNFYQLIDDIANGIVEKIVYHGRNGNEREFEIKSIINSNDFCLNLIATDSERTFAVENKIDSTLKLHIAIKRIELRGTKLRGVHIHYSTGEIVNLLEYINREGLFTVAFHNSEIRYTAKSLFRDSKLLGNIDYFLGFIHAKTCLTHCTSEKGNVQAISDSFDNDCLFGAIETHLSNDCDFLICDDLGDEWADYIGVKKNFFVRFYHAKHSTSLYSATAFHDVVAQALKNIGHFDFNKDLSAKLASISAAYAGSQIDRLRKGDSAVNCLSCLQETYNSSKVDREVIIVVNFLNKNMLKSELSKLKRGEPTRNQTIQILWQLSSLICVCQEKGIKLKIFTKP